MVVPSDTASVVRSGDTPISSIPAPIRLLPMRSPVRVSNVAIAPSTVGFRNATESSPRDATELSCRPSGE